MMTVVGHWVKSESDEPGYESVNCDDDFYEEGDPSVCKCFRKDWTEGVGLGR